MRIAILYYSGTGNTEQMAQYIAQGVREAGYSADVIPISQCQKDLLIQYDKIMFGCPASAEDELEEIEFLPYYEEIEADLGETEIALFGSYGWGDGQWMRDWEKRVKSRGLRLYKEGLIILDDPTSYQQECRDFGYQFVTSEE
jgi:flavodoxin I